MGTPLTILTGFLGSGKTTLLNRIVTGEHGLRIAVIENELGEVAVDAALVLRQEDALVELTNGCVCCGANDAYYAVLRTLARRETPFDRVIVETTGVADPAPVAQAVLYDPELRARFTLDGIVAMVDARHVEEQLDEVPVVAEQIAFADVIVLNKLDLVDDAAAARVTDRVRGINGAARLLPATLADVPLAAVLDVGTLRRDALDAHTHDHPHDAISTVTLRVPGAVDTPRFYDWLAGVLMGRYGRIYRGKGRVRFTYGGPHGFQSVHQWFDVHPIEAADETTLVLIGRDLDVDGLRAGLGRCAAG